MNSLSSILRKRAKEVLLAVLPAFFMIAVPFDASAPYESYASFSPATPQGPPGEARPEPLLAMGKVLVAAKNQRDPRFARTVILLLDNSSLGSAGLIVNRPTRMRIGAVLSDIKGLKGRMDAVFYGGPGRPDRAMALVRSSKAAPSRSLKVFDSVYIGAGKGFFDGLMDGIGPGDEFRVSSGYVKGDHHELDWEVSMGAWKVMDATPEIVFAREPETLWPRLAR